eukprot:gene26329-32289_t
MDDRNPHGGKDKNGKNGKNTPINPRIGNEPVAGEGHEPKDGEEEDDDVMSVAHEFEFNEGGGNYIEIERGGGNTDDILRGGD